MKLPVMKCDEGCGDCCGPVPVTHSEYDRVIEYAQKHSITPMKQGITCPFYQEGKCKVYEVRPLICVVFGHSERLVCSKGYNKNIPERKIRRAIMKNGECVKHLHDVLPGGMNRVIYELKQY